MGLSLGHLFLILIIVLVIWGPSRLGGVGRGIGDAVRGFKKGLHGDDEIDITNTARRISNETPPAKAQHPSPTQIRDVGSNSVDDSLAQAAREKAKTERS